MEFLDSYFSDYEKLVKGFLAYGSNKKDLNIVVDLLKATRNKNKIYLIGNGGSSAIAEHMAIDLTKNAGLAAMAFSGTPMLTTFSNDYGYEYVFEKCIETFCEQGDVLIAISSSGNSPNIINATRRANEKGLKTVTFTGFKEGNPLSQIGHINFWVNSKAFGYVEIFHNFLIHYINDAIIGAAEYFIKGNSDERPAPRL